MNLGPSGEVVQPTRVQTAGLTTGTVPTGAYAVQISSQKSEADAKSSYRAMQRKYPDVLGGREPTIRRADLGDKGIYYRAQIDGFANAADAGSFCGGLKAAGGQCIVQKN